MPLSEHLPGTKLHAPANTPAATEQSISTNPETLSSQQYIAHVEISVDQTIASANYLDEDGYISTQSWARLVQQGHLLDAALDDRDTDPSTRQHEAMEIARLLAKRDINLGLSYGIMVALVIQPLQHFHRSPQQRDHWLDQIRHGKLFGLAITELNGSGSAALNMESNYTTNNQTGLLTLNASKRLQGNSNTSGLIIAALKLDDQASTPSVGLIMTPQKYIDSTTTQTQGLTGVRYAQNIVENAQLSTDLHLLHEFSGRGLLQFQELFVRSRLQLVALALGHLESTQTRTHHETTNTTINGSPKAEHFLVKPVLAEISARRALVEALHNHVIATLTPDGDVSRRLTEANIIKTLSMECAFISSLLRARLIGGNSFYAQGALQDAIDFYPFEIFEGPKDVLLTQIAKGLLKPPPRSGIRSFAKADEWSNLLEYIEAIAPHRLDLFLSQSFCLLSGQSLRALDQIPPGDYSENPILGAIFSRLFALGILNKTPPTDVNQITNIRNATTLLNVEIQQLAIKFHYPLETD